MMNILQWKRRGPFTAVLGTAYTALIDPVIRGRSIITRLAITNLGTIHTMTIMQVLKKYTLATAFLASQKIIPMAVTTDFTAGDFIAIKLPNGKYEQHLIASVQAAVSITTTANIGMDCPAKTPMCFFGAVADGHEQISIPASVTTVFQAEDGYFGANEMSEPMIVHVNNITAASIIQAINCPVIAV